MSTLSDLLQQQHAIEARIEIALVDRLPDVVESGLPAPWTEDVELEIRARLAHVARQDVVGVDGSAAAD